MPCYSTIRTKMTEEGRLKNALLDLNHVVRVSGGRIIAELAGRTTVYEKQSDGSYAVVSGSVGNLSAISRRYAEIGVREWAKRKGYAVTESDGRKIKLVNRRAT